MEAKQFSAQRQRVIAMNITTLAYPNDIANPSTLHHPSSSDTILPKDAAPQAGSAAKG
jgi:hypothetical protein